MRTLLYQRIQSQRRLPARPSRQPGAAARVIPAHPVLQLQHTLGNRAVGRLLATQGAGGANATRQAHLQRKMGDGHDLKSPRFAGDPVLEACFDNERLLRVGDAGAAVKKVQEALVATGFPLPRFGADGKFGSETKGAVESFQKDAGLTGRDVDGIVGPTTMGLLDGRRAVTPPQPATECGDQAVNTDKDPLPPVPPFTPTTMSAPDLLELVKKLQPRGAPVPKKPPLGASQPSFTPKPLTVKALVVPGSSCMKCVADWDVAAEFRAFIATGSFSDEPKRFAAIQQGDVSGCPSKPIPDLLEVRKVILPEALPFILAGEFEHYLDFVRAFRIAAGRYLANVRRLTPERTHLRAADQSGCANKVGSFLAQAVGFPDLGALFLAIHNQLFVEDFEKLYNSPNRDGSGSHSAVAHPPEGQRPIFPNIDTDKNPFGCQAFCRKFNARSFPGIPGGSSEALVVDTNEPEKKAWHAL